jgi:chemotaxis protein methyltransferase CheR
MTPSDFEFLKSLLSQQSGIVLEPGKEYLVEARLAPLVQEAGAPGTPELLRLARPQAAAELRRRIVEAMTTNETSFFRDLHPFDLMRTRVLPRLLERRAAVRRLDLWCAASSTGQEPYSLAMLLLEHFPLLRDWQVRILATDLSEETLAKAKEGSYSQMDVSRGLPPALLAKYFDRDGARWRVGPAVRRLVEFRQMNLAAAWPSLPRMDVVFLRNVLIYFAVQTKRQILERMHGQLAADGCLFLGTAETTLGVCEAFDREASERAVLYRPRQSVRPVA